LAGQGNPSKYKKYFAIFIEFSALAAGDHPAAGTAGTPEKPLNGSGRGLSAFAAQERPTCSAQSAPRLFLFGSAGKIQ